MANEKILVVDDDTNICELLRLYLTKEGYQVTTANDGEEGLEKFNQLKPDMVLLDVMMPRMDGLEVCRRIRKLGNTPVMMLTAKGETFDKVLGLELAQTTTWSSLRHQRGRGPHQGGAAPLHRHHVPDREHRGRHRVRQPPSRHEQLRAAGQGKGGGSSPEGAGTAELPRLSPQPSIPATSCWTRCGASNTTATAAPSTSMSSACARSWPVLPINGS